MASSARAKAATIGKQAKSDLPEAVFGEPTTNRSYTRQRAPT